MAYQTIKNVKIAGIAASVPVHIEENHSLNLFQSSEDFNKFVASTGVERRRKSPKELCASDLCLQAAEQLIEKLKWEKKEIECLIFVSHSPDYRFPATACILQSRLGLQNECMSLDISLGCSGWVYGLSTIASLISASKFKKGLLLAGDTTTFSKSPKDKGTYPLFGDSGSATALEYAEGANEMFFHMATDGKNYDAIIMEDGGCRNCFNEKSLIETEFEDGSIRNKMHTSMDGMTVFSFGITKVPKSVRKFLDKFNINKDEIDFFVFHQANKMINGRIQKKLNIPDNKMPSILKNFGNTSSGSIPLTMVVELKDQINEIGEKPLSFITCGFGVGLSWGSAYFRLNNAISCDLIEVSE